MQRHHLAVTITVALLFSQCAIASAAPQSNILPGEEMVIRTNQEWKRVRADASSAEAFRALANWADSQARLFKRKESESEDQLHRSYPMNSARNRILANTVEHDKKKAKYWSDLSSLYRAKADAVTVASGAKQ